MVIAFIHFLANLLIAGVIIRLLEAHFGKTWLGKSLTFAY